MKGGCTGATLAEWQFEVPLIIVVERQTLSHKVDTNIKNHTLQQNFPDIGSPEGLAVDWVSRNIYWTDSTRDTIEVASIEGKRRRVLFNDSLVNPRGIAVHPQRG